jgi:hypothetical protein
MAPGTSKVVENYNLKPIGTRAKTFRQVAGILSQLRQNISHLKKKGGLLGMGGSGPVVALRN